MLQKYRHHSGNASDCYFVDAVAMMHCLWDISRVKSSFDAAPTQSKKLIIALRSNEKDMHMGVLRVTEGRCLAVVVWKVDPT